MSSERRGLLLVVSSPSGAGKTSLSRRLAGAHAEIELSISATTRAPRPGELDGREYHFTDEASFAEAASTGAFLEWAEVHGQRYGTPRAPVEAALTLGRDVLFDIDWQGAAAVRTALPEETVSVFILPPTMEALAHRLRARAQDASAVIERRLARAREEIAHWDEYDYVIVNDAFEHAYAQLEAIYIAERQRRRRNAWLGGFVGRLIS